MEGGEGGGGPKRGKEEKLERGKKDRSNIVLIKVKINKNIFIIIKGS